MKIVGTVTSGYGSATNDVLAGRYPDLGYDPYPGTLNLAVASMPELPRDDNYPIEANLDGIEVQLWPATVADIEGHLLTGGFTPNTIELLAPVRLRDALGVEDGDEVEVEVA